MNSTESIEFYLVLADPLSVSYLITISNQLAPSRLRIGRVIPDSADFFNPEQEGYENFGGKDKDV